MNCTKCISKNSTLVIFCLQGFMSKRGHQVKNWKERWMVLTPNDLKYYVSSLERNLKGTIVFDKSQTVEVIHITIYCTRFYLSSQIALIFFLVIYGTDQYIILLGHDSRPIYTICSLHSCLSIADNICLISLFRRYVISHLS